MSKIYAYADLVKKNSGLLAVMNRKLLTGGNSNNASLTTTAEKIV